MQNLLRLSFILIIGVITPSLKKIFAMVPDNNKFSGGFFSQVYIDRLPPTSAHINQIKALQFTPDEEFLISGADNPCEVKVWHCATGTFYRTIPINLKHINHLEVIPQSNFFVVSSFDCKASIWNWRTGEFITDITVSSPIQAIKTSSLGISFLYEELVNNTKRFIIENRNIFTNKIYSRKTLNDEDPDDNNFIQLINPLKNRYRTSKDGKFIVGMTCNNHLSTFETGPDLLNPSFFDLDPGVGNLFEIQILIKASKSYFYTLALSPNGKFIAAGDNHGRIFWWYSFDHTLLKGLSLQQLNFINMLHQAPFNDTLNNTIFTTLPEIIKLFAKHYVQNITTIKKNKEYRDKYKGTHIIYQALQ